MAKTLKDFLEERAKNDFVTAELLYKNTGNGVSTEERLLALKKQALMRQYFDPSNLSDMKMTADKAVLNRVSLMMLSVAGEAVKKLENEVPDIHNRFPNFPWKNFKRIRDWNVKYGEATTESEWDAILIRINKEIEAINTLGIFDAEEHPDLPYFYLIHICLNWASAIDKFAASSPSNPVSLAPSPELAKLAQVVGMPQAEVPILLEAQAARDTLHSVFEQLKLPSVFFRRSHQKLYNSPHIEKLKSIRNKYAHFEDFFAADAKTTPESYFLALTIFDEAEFAALTAAHKHIRGQLGRVRDALYYRDTAAYAGQLATEYQAAVLGLAANDSEKTTLMDEQVAWVTSNALKPRTEDAFVLAVGDLLQRSTIDQAQSILSYVRAHKNDLGKPGELLKNLQGQNHVVQAGVCNFVSTLQYGLGIPVARSAA